MDVVDHGSTSCEGEANPQVPVGELEELLVGAAERAQQGGARQHVRAPAPEHVPPQQSGRERFGIRGCVAMEEAKSLVDPDRARVSKARIR